MFSPRSWRRSLILAVNSFELILHDDNVDWTLNQGHLGPAEKFYSACEAVCLMTVFRLFCAALFDLMRQSYPQLCVCPAFSSTEFPDVQLQLRN